MRSKDYIVPGNMISAKVAIKARYGNADFLNVDLTEIKLLSNQRNTLNQVSVVVDLNHLDDQKVEELYHIIQENQGKCKVNFVILSDDPVYNKMNLVTTDYKVNISRNMLEQLEKTTGYRPTMN